MTREESASELLKKWKQLVSAESKAWKLAEAKKISYKLANGKAWVASIRRSSNWKEAQDAALKLAAESDKATDAAMKLAAESDRALDLVLRAEEKERKP